MSKQDKQAGGGAFPAPLEILKCKEGNKEFMRERPARKPYGSLFRVCKFNLENVDEDYARLVWKMAKKTARDFLRVTWNTTAIVKAEPRENAVCVYCNCWGRREK